MNRYYQPVFIYIHHQMIMKTKAELHRYELVDLVQQHLHQE